jgi:dolichyl-phosphate-mannose--protein O-mannosyl transferase
MVGMKIMMMVIVMMGIVVHSHEDHDHDHDHDHDTDLDDPGFTFVLFLLLLFFFVFFTITEFTSLFFFSFISFSFSSSSLELQYVTCGSILSIIHVPSKHRLHSHDVKYGGGSGQQSVTGYEDKGDSNNYWVVMEGYGLPPCSCMVVRDEGGNESEMVDDR